MIERTCRTCVHWRCYSDDCGLWGCSTTEARRAASNCGRQLKSWFPATWSRRAALRPVTWLERLGVLR